MDKEDTLPGDANQGGSFTNGFRGGQLLVEFPMRPGATEVASFNVDDLYQRSAAAVSSAMDNIKTMAEKVKDTATSIPEEHRPNQIEVDFGLKLEMQAGAIIARAGGEASIQVKLTWTNN